MRSVAATAGLPVERFSHRGAEVLLVARLRDDPSEPNVRRRMVPDIPSLAQFFASPAHCKPSPDRAGRGALARHLCCAHAGVYRAVPPRYFVARHALEPLDGQHLLALLTRQTVML